MAVVKEDDVAGYVLEREIICCDCVAKEDEDAATEDEIITQRSVEKTGKSYYCSICKEQL